jgi:DNA end-binding protein Ku
MPPHALGSGTISFGLVSIPVQMYTAVASSGVSFNLLHATCGKRVRQQLYCPKDGDTVERSGVVRGYEFAKDEYVRFTDEELKGLEGEASRVIDIAEFVPLAEVDPIYFDKTYYLGPDKGGEKAYHLLAEAMAKTDRVALAKFVMRGKESLVLIRPAQGGLVLHTMYFADEVRDGSEIERAQSAQLKDGDQELAVQLVDELSRADFDPGLYRDDYSQRVLDAANRKVEGQEVTAVGPEVQRAQVIDLMDALRESLAKRSRGTGSASPAERKPPAKVEGIPAPAGGSKRARRAQGDRK